VIEPPPLSKTGKRTSLFVRIILKGKNLTLGKFKVGRLRFRYAVFLLTCTSASIQQVIAQQILWERVFDTGVKDQGTGFATDSQGNIIVAGTTVPQSVQPPNHEDFLIVKYNLLGDTLWTRRFDAAVYEAAAGVAIDNADNIIVVGSTHTDTTYSAMRIVKYDRDGNILYARTSNSGEKDIGEFGAGVATDSKNNIVVAGNRNSNWGDYTASKYDSSGNLLWVRTYDGGWEDCATDVAVDDSDNVIVTGYSDSNNNWDWCTIKYSPSGDTLWIKRYDATIDDWAYGVTADKEGNIIVCGQVRPVYRSRGAVVKYNRQGDTVWTRIFSDPLEPTGVQNFVDVAGDNSGNIYLIGNYVIWDGTKRFVDYYIAKCTSSGDTLWILRCDLNWEDEASGITLDRWNDVIVTGTTSANPNMGEYDYLTVKLHNVTNGVPEENVAPRGFFLHPNYPNPFNPSTVISYQLPACSFISLKVFDLLGREIETLVSEEKLAGTYTAIWNATRFANGIYIARLSAGNFVASIKLLLIR